MKNIKILKTIALVLAIALCLGLAFFANGLVGNPVSHYLAKSSAHRHIESTYADKDFSVESVSYDFKSGCYNAFIESPSSPDSSFSLSISFGGKIYWDSYEDRVLNGYNTSERINNEYRKTVESVIESKSFPYATNIAFGDICFVEDVNLDQPYVPDYAIKMSSLELDGYYDIAELGAKAGELVIYVNDNDVSVEKLSEILLSIKDVMDKTGVKFKVINCVLEPVKSEEAYSAENRVEVEDFPYEDIYKTGMLKRVSKAVEETKALNEIRDAEIKQQEAEAYQNDLEAKSNRSN